eukprot:4287231-Amphidinium_carterae.1
MSVNKKKAVGDASAEKVSTALLAAYVMRNYEERASEDLRQESVSSRVVSFPDPDSTIMMATNQFGPRANARNLEPSTVRHAFPSDYSCRTRLGWHVRGLPMHDLHCAVFAGDHLGH